MVEETRPNFYDFVSYLSTTPHVTEAILMYLDVSDVVNCLRTCKPLRQAIKNTIKGHSKVKEHLDSDLRPQDGCAQVEDGRLSYYLFK